MCRVGWPRLETQGIADATVSVCYMLAEFPLTRRRSVFWSLQAFN